MQVAELTICERKILSRGLRSEKAILASCTLQIEFRKLRSGQTEQISQVLGSEITYTRDQFSQLARDNRFVQACAL